MDMLSCLGYCIGGHIKWSICLFAHNYVTASGSVSCILRSPTYSLSPSFQYSMLGPDIVWDHVRSFDGANNDRDVM